MASVNLNLQVVYYRICRQGGVPLSTKLAYKGDLAGQPSQPSGHNYMEELRANKCRIFIWLANKDRVYTNERRLRRSIATSDACHFCGATECNAHLLLYCNNLLPVWDGLRSIFNGRPDNLWEVWLGGALSNKVRSIMIIHIPWNTEKRHNTKVFRNETPGVRHIAKAAADDLLLWSHRCKKC
ncbi:hypothetical protein VPH35_015781 [Triticum aestivum]|uniref:Reverse transcriptase zinc-binding domain-containing protein n=1 Tax=Aegilops tauschii subsp. strangulata TaxID=200361 RepID=A0A452ZBY5_AEGTS